MWRQGQAAGPSGTGKPGPTITSITPATGVNQGDTVTITGNHFTSHGAASTTLTVNGGSVTPTVVSNTSITFPAPAFPTDAPKPTLVLTNSNGTWTQPLAFAYAVQVLTSLDPATGVPEGGEDIDLVGTHFSDDMIVLVDGVVNGTVVVSSATAAVWTTGAHALDTVDVAVRSVLGTSNTLTGGFEYEEAPDLSPHIDTVFSHPDEPRPDLAVVGRYSGHVRITGSNFQAEGAGTPVLTLNSVQLPPEYVAVISDTIIDAYAYPDDLGFSASPRSYDWIVTTDLGASNAIPITIAPSPIFVSITPNSGPAAGGTPVAVVGDNLKYLGIDLVSISVGDAGLASLVTTDDEHADGTTQTDGGGPGLRSVTCFTIWFDGFNEADAFTFT